MSDDLKLCREQARVQRINAAAAVLGNVRERCERAARTWEALADRAERIEREQRERADEPFASAAATG